MLVKISNKNQTDGENMEYITLKQGLKLPLLGFGTWDLRGEECIRSVERAIGLGYTLIDTAQMYQNEKEVGLGIQNAKVNRDKLFITTKVCGSANSYGKTKLAVDESLKNLNVDFIDLYLIHEPYQQANEMYQALMEAKDAGKIRAIGISNYNQRRLELFMKECGEMPAVNQIESHVFYPQLELVEYMKKYEIAAQAWGPLAQGKNHIFSNEVLTSLGEKYKKSAAQVALRFLVQNQISVVPKSAKEMRMIQNQEIFDFRLTEDEMQEIKHLNTGHSLSPWTSMWE